MALFQTNNGKQKIELVKKFTTGITTAQTYYWDAGVKVKYLFYSILTYTIDNNYTNIIKFYGSNDNSNWEYVGEINKLFYSGAQLETVVFNFDYRYLKTINTYGGSGSGKLFYFECDVLFIK